MPAILPFPSLPGPTPDADGWIERWTLEYANTLLPVELYYAGRPAAAGGSRLILPFGPSRPVFVAVRLGAERPA